MAYHLGSLGLGHDLVGAPDARGRERAEKSGAYGAYKAQLDKMFTPGGGGLPEHLKAQLGPVSEESAARQKANADFRNQPSDASLRAYLDAGFDLPDDARFLMSTFEALEDESHLRLVLERLLEIVESGKKPNRMLLLQRLTSLERDVEEDETLTLVADLRGALE
ncbi:MAG: hypothetical protein AAFZ18_09045 [Myxococcota bacterium]